ncbi:MAG: hypothetical protein RMJ19_12120 [Gemmatales bacterium]|nr:hypothetical protein [Gemmatales bacterium]MCS7161209.1 hypothetical protein [Gemmatales bacterium]MDW8176412.1 hypothetical protein [Gemmatales bacterium]MDW8221453.1 hypothetical protein [Gemmatales bacterium]
MQTRLTPTQPRRVGLLALFLGGLVGLCALFGCQRPGADPQPKKISMDEYSKMPLEERHDPYVLQHLQSKPANLP